jgi:DnaJ-class molecular chaperone
MARWHICPTCSGDGAHSIALGVINRDEWSDDELDGYMAGDYDSICETCKGAGKITEDQIQNYKPVKSYSSDQEYYFYREGGY